LISEKFQKHITPYKLRKIYSLNKIKKKRVYLKSPASIKKSVVAKRMKESILLKKSLREVI
jgi:hypothetical protein